MFKFVILFLVISCLVNQLIVISVVSHRIVGHNRQKKQLFIEELFVNGTNTVKSSLGISFPMDLADPVNYRTLLVLYNFQAQYQLMPPATQSLARFERSLHNQKVDYAENITCCYDATRQMFYNAFEIVTLRKGINGKECLLRAICENAQSPIRVTGIFHEILNLILTPSEIGVDKCYIDAKNAGAVGADCFQLYNNCPIGHGFLDTIS